MQDNPFQIRDVPPFSPEPDEWLLWEARLDDRLRYLVYLDGRLVDTWSAPVAGTQWEPLARRFDDERHPPPPPPPPPPPAHELVLRWLDAVAGGREAVLSLTVDPPAPPDPPTFADPDTGADFQAVAEHLDRVSGAFFDEEVAGALDQALHLLWSRRPTVLTRQPPNAVAGGLVWVVGKANGLFDAGPRQQAVQRELWMRQSLSVAGQRIAPGVRGIALEAGPRPVGTPDLLAFAEPRLLTPRTRRELIAWRDRALAAARHADS